MSRHFLPGMLPRGGRAAPRGYRSGQQSGQAPRGAARNAAAPPGRGDGNREHEQAKEGNEEIPGKENKEGTRVNTCSITSTSENYKIILWLASG